ncbi:LamG domain-containing protein [Micromonospora sp. NBC_01412]|uniref:LamG domain-containing protein n=1 Tax=Micromonospora sp. NBC_01412 TaxID=2903590 RepID=UPI00324C38BB
MTALDRGLALHLTLTQDDRRTVVDSSGNGNNGTARGRAQPVDDPTLGRCYQFNGTTDYVEIPPLGRTDTVTIQLWVRADVLDRTRTVLACADWPTGNLLIEFVNTRLKVNLTGGEPGDQIFGYAFTANRWYHLAVSYSRRDQRISLYVDGKLTETRQYGKTAEVNLTGAWVGGRNAGTYFQGRIGSLRIYRRALTEDQIRQIMQIDLAKLVLHLPLDELRDNAAVDAAGSTLAARATGTPSTVLDEFFGRSLRFDGTNEMLTMPDAEALRLGAYTVSIWLKPDGPPPTLWQGIVGKPGRNFNIWLNSAGHIHHRFNAGGNWNTGAPDTPPGSIAWNAWNHVAITNDGTTATTYINGVLAATGPTGGAPVVNNAPLLLAGDLDGAASGHRFKGNLAHLRIFRAALPAEAIQRGMAVDQAAVTSVRRSHPLVFDLLDGDDETVLPIDSDPTGHQLFLEITNSADQPVLLDPITTAPTATNHHLALRFRAGTLAAPCLDPAKPQQLVRVAADGWQISKPVSEDQTVVFYLASTRGRTLEQGRTWHLTLEHAIADVAGGTRATRVELHYRQLRYAGQTTALEGHRRRILKIINRLGKPEIPLHAGFTGGNSVLNDSRSESMLVLHVANLAADGPIPLAPRDTSQNPTRLRISFDHEPTTRATLDRPWALGTGSDLKDVDIPANAAVRTGWQVERTSVEGEATELVLTPIGKTSLGLREIVEIPLARIRSSLPSGPANLYLRYENVPGYQDGQFICPVVKGPLVANGSYVGVGTSSPAAPLHVQEATGTGHGPNSGSLLIDHDNGGGASSIVFRSRVNRGSDYGFIQYQDAAATGGAGESARLIVGTSNDPDDHVILQPAGNVGVGAPNPKAKLHVDGDYYGRGHLHLYAYEGDGRDGTAFVQARDDSGRTSLGLRLRTQTQGRIVDAIHLNPDGNVALGHADPRSRLTVHGSTNISADGAPVGLMTMLFNGRMNDGESRTHQLYNLTNHCTSWLELTVLIHDTNSNTHRLLTRVEYVAYREWTEAPKVEMLAQPYRKTGARSIYNAGVAVVGNDIQAQVSQSGFATNSVYKVLARYLIGKS